VLTFAEPSPRAARSSARRGFMSSLAEGVSSLFAPKDSRAPRPGSRSVSPISGACSPRPSFAEAPDALEQCGAKVAESHDEQEVRQEAARNEKQEDRQRDGDLLEKANRKELEALEAMPPPPPRLVPANHGPSIYVVKGKSSQDDSAHFSQESKRSASSALDGKSSDTSLPPRTFSIFNSKRIACAPEISSFHLASWLHASFESQMPCLAS